MPLNLSSALRPFLLSLNVFLARTTFDTANSHNNGVTTFDYLCMLLIKAVLATEEMSLILFLALPF